MKYEYYTTRGELIWDNAGLSVDGASEPEEPFPGNNEENEYGDWEMVGSVIGAMRRSVQPILWFWRREIKNG